MKKIFNADLNNIRPMINFIKNEIKKLGVSESILKKMHVIAEEIIINIINYAYQKDDFQDNVFNDNSDKLASPNSNNTSPKIELICYLTKNKELVIRFVDWGYQFDPLKSNHQKIPIQKIRMGHMGIGLIKMMSDSLSYERSENKNILTVIMKNA